jgi:hypothetical protein
MSNKGNPLQHSEASLRSWANTIDRRERASHGARAHFQKFLDQYDGDEKRARAAWRAHFKHIARMSIKARKAKADKSRKAGDK